MKPRLLPAILTMEDVDIWCQVYLRRGRSPEFGVVPAAAADRRDADAMLIMVELHASRIVQATTGDWCYFGHSSEVVFSNETVQ